MRYTTHRVPVPDGALTVGEWRTGERPLLAIHGVSSTHKLWLWTVAALRGFRVLAPDLRGRGASQGFARFGMGANVEDVLAVLDHFEIETLPVVGMSLGAYVAARLAAEHPGRVESLVLVDGGIPAINFPQLRSLTREQVAASFEDRLQRIRRPWPSFEAYRDFVIAATTPLLSKDDPLLEEDLRYDLSGEAPNLVVRLDGGALVADASDLYLSDGAERAARGIASPARMLYAEWSVGRGTPPSYTAEHLEPWAARIPDFQARLLPGTDHAATVMTLESGLEVAREIEALAGVTP